MFGAISMRTGSRSSRDEFAALFGERKEFRNLSPILIGLGMFAASRSGRGRPPILPSVQMPRLQPGVITALYPRETVPPPHPPEIDVGRTEMVIPPGERVPADPQSGFGDRAGAGYIRADAGPVEKCQLGARGAEF